MLNPCTLVDANELDHEFVSSLIANAFFSTFPKRTDKSHPTLQNFNFTNFFKRLQCNYQKAKLKSIFYYFDWLDRSEENSKGCVKFLRQVNSILYHKKTRTFANIYHNTY